MNERKEVYVQPTLVIHGLLRDITSRGSRLCDRPVLGQILPRCN
jgi:hypothetical protein